MLAELFRREPGIPRDAAHGKRIDGIMARDRHDALTVGHHDMLALASDPKADLFQHPDRLR